MLEHAGARRQPSVTLGMGRGRLADCCNGAPICYFVLFLEGVDVIRMASMCTPVIGPLRYQDDQFPGCCDHAPLALDASAPSCGSGSNLDHGVD
jgi:hypothetical protein